MNDTELADLLTKACNEHAAKGKMTVAANSLNGTWLQILQQLRQTLSKLGIPFPTWPQLLQILLTVLPMVLSGQPIAAIIAAVLALLGIPAPPTP